MLPESTTRTGGFAGQTLLFVVTEDWYFCSHRLPLAAAARQAGFEVAIATRVSEHGDAIRACGITVHPWDIARGSTGLWRELRALRDLWRIYRKVRPDLVHAVALKPVLYGSLLARFAGIGGMVNALGGMGSVFTSTSARQRRLKSALMIAFKWLLGSKRSVLILQNEDDARLFEQGVGLNRERLRIVRGAGVDLTQFNVRPEPTGIPLVVLPARMLWDKGVGEFVAAAALLRAQGYAARFALVGGIDPCNPSAIEQAQLTAWIEAGAVEWWGMRRDMPDVLAMANIVCLPSYREGLPKALLEAAASARAIVTTDVPGCREVVREGVNGTLVPVRDAAALAAALARLLEASDLRAAMGRAGRLMAEQEFSEQRVSAETLAIYAAQLTGSPRSQT